MSGLAKREVFGMRRSALVEIGLYLIVAVALDYFFFRGDRFWNASLHPFWPLIVLVAAQYGTAEGLLAAFASSAVLLLGNVPEQSINQDSYEYLLAVTKNPLMWAVSALILGEIRMRHLREKQRLEGELDEAGKHTRELAAAYGRLSAIKSDLENRVAGQVRTAMTIYQASRSLEKINPGEVLLGVMDTVRAVMNPKKCSLYLLREDALEISIAEGWRPNDTNARVVNSKSSLFQEIVGRQRVLCAASPDDEIHLGKEGVLAGPLIDRETGEVIGMLKIESLGFLELHVTNVQTFKMLCDWIADSYVHARSFQKTKAESLINPHTGMLTRAFFEKQKELQIQLGKRMGFDVSLILIRVEPPLREGHQADALQMTIGEAAVGVLRYTDLLFEYQTEGSQYCVLLPATGKSQAQAVADKLRQTIEPMLESRFSGARLMTNVQCLYTYEPTWPLRDAI